MIDFLDAANDGMLYSFLDGQDEQIFGSYSLLDQKNGSHGMGPENGDPTRIQSLQDNTNKNRSLETLMSSRNQDLDISIPGGSKQNLNKN